MVDPCSPPRIRLGLVCVDPLRIAGVQAIFAEQRLEVVDMSLPGALDDTTLSAVLIDAASTEHVFELLAAFRRTRPHLRLIVVGLEEDHEHIQRVIGAGARVTSAHTARERRDSDGAGDCAGWIGVGSAEGAGEAAGDVSGTIAQAGGGKKGAITAARGRGAASAGGRDVLTARSPVLWGSMRLR